MMQTPSVLDADGTRIRNSLRAYFEKQPNCTLKWVRGVVGPAAPFAKRVMTTEFARYENTREYRELHAIFAIIDP
jgi:hypothetical protein